MPIDTKEVTRLVSKLYDGKFSRVYTEKDIRRILRQKNLWIFTSKKKGRVIGMVALYMIELFSRRLAVIEGVAVLEDYRKHGVGSRLIKAAISKAKKLKVNCVELNVRADKPGIQKFYKNLGFYDRNNKVMRLWINKPHE